MTHTVRSGLWFAPFNDAADAGAIAALAAEAEEHGWDGFFLWDHLFWTDTSRPVADAWIALSAAATSTDTIRLGPMVTPLARRRPAQLVRETATLDRLSEGRLTLGVGLGSDRFGQEYTRTGETLGARARASALDETLTVLRRAWTGDTVDLDGHHVTLRDARFLPTPAQRHHLPVWVAGKHTRTGPLQRAARHHGFFPQQTPDPESLVSVADRIRAAREASGQQEPFDLIVARPPGADTRAWTDAGATWLLTDLSPDNISVDTVRGVLRDGPFT